jgi:CDGSH-type Zn-finger protein
VYDPFKLFEGHAVDREVAKITPYQNGPYLVRGPFTITDQDGNEIAADRRVVALCRCGRSQIRPFCDGTHKAIRFRAESGDSRRHSDDGAVDGASA